MWRSIKVKDETLKRIDQLFKELCKGNSMGSIGKELLVGATRDFKLRKLLDLAEDKIKGESK